MSFSGKSLKIKSAVKSRSKFDLSSHHLTTLDFGQIVPIHIQHEVIPGDSFNCTQNLFSRVAPLAVPTYGNVWLKTATFFVPIHQIAQDMESWLAGDLYYNGKLTSGRTVPFKSLMAVFLRDSTNSFNTSNPAASNFGSTWKNQLCERVSVNEHYDFCFVNASSGSSPNAIIAFRFTAQGRYWYKVFRSLGYGFFDGMTLNKDYPNYVLWNKSINIVPLLSYFKAYNDWMSQSALYNRSQMSVNLAWFRYEYPRVWSDSTVVAFRDNIYTMFNSVLLQYESNYFTTAWQAPNEIIEDQGYNNAGFAPDTGIQSITNGYDPNLNDSINLQTGPIRTSNNEPADMDSYSAIGIRFLNSFDKWLRRNNYSGARSVEKLLSRFGIKTEDYRNEFAILIDTSKSILQIGDVTNQTDTGDLSRPLGSYAGKGIVNGDNKWSFKSSDFGTLITLAWLQPDVQYYSGIDRTVLKTSVSDFYQPEYDGLDASPIANCELESSSRITTRFNDPFGVFGFTERYAELKQPKSRVTGDFAIYPDMSSWHLGIQPRSIDGITPKAQSAELISQPQFGSQFDRIFVDDTPNSIDMVDHFYLTAYFDINASRPMMNSSEVANLGEGNLNIQRNGTQMS